MLAQQKLLDGTSTTTSSATEQNDKLFQILLQFLHANGVPVDPDLLEKRLDEVDISNTEALITQLNDYLALDLGLEKEQCVDVDMKARALFPTALAAAGVQISIKNEETQVNGIVENGVNGDGVEKPKPVKIEDVHGWKAGLQVSAGPRPVKALEEFEELEAKL